MEAFESVVLYATRYGLTVSLATIAFNINEGGFLLRGQTGDFTIDVDGMPVRIEQDGMFGLGMKSSPYHGFSAHAVDYQKPFISETGYRSFMGCHAEMAPGVTPDAFAREMIRSYMQRECKGKPRKIDRSYVEREMARRAEKDNQKVPEL